MISGRAEVARGLLPWEPMAHLEKQSAWARYGAAVGGTVRQRMDRLDSLIESLGEITQRAIRHREPEASQHAMGGQTTSPAPSKKDKREFRYRFRV